MTAHGELWLVAGDKPRPAVVLTRDPVARLLSGVLVAPVTSTVRGLAVEVPVGEADGLRRPSVVNVDQVQRIDRSAFLHRLGRVRPATMREICAAMHLAMDC